MVTSSLDLLGALSLILAIVIMGSAGVGLGRTADGRSTATRLENLKAMLSEARTC